MFNRKTRLMVAPRLCSFGDRFASERRSSCAEEWSKGFGDYKMAHDAGSASIGLNCILTFLVLCCTYVPARKSRLPIEEWAPDVELNSIAEGSN